LVHRLGERIDAFNHDAFKNELELILQKGQRFIALDLNQTKFLSVPSIALLSVWADRLKSEKGRLMLVGPSEKIKRQIKIFGSLDLTMVVRSVQQLTKEELASESPALDESPGF
jgi:anti-anti-sigma factor